MTQHFSDDELVEILAMEHTSDEAADPREVEAFFARYELTWIAPVQVSSHGKCQKRRGVFDE